MSGRTWQDIPDWLIYAVRGQHAVALSGGRDRADEDSVDLLTTRLLAEDPEFTRVVITRYIRTLIRAPKPRRRSKKDRERDNARLPVMAECVRLRAEGLSLQKIGEKTGVSHTTVRKMLAEWETRLPELPPGIVARSLPASETGPVNLAPAGFTAEVSAPDPNVIPLRRLA